MRVFRPSPGQSKSLGDGAARALDRAAPSSHGLSAICPRISPPAKSPGPVFAGAVPLSGCTFPYVSPLRISESRASQEIPSADGKVARVVDPLIAGLFAVGPAKSPRITGPAI